MCSHESANAGNCSEHAYTAPAPSRGHCHCTPQVPRGFMYPGIMLLIAEEPSHGYTLMDKLAEMGLVKEKTDLSIVYRILRQLEEDGLAVSEHIDEGRGPARKVYRLTDEGREALSSWTDHMDDLGRLIDEFRKRYQSLEKDR